LTAVEASTAPELLLAGIGVRFGGLAALDDVSFSVGSNEIVGLIGPNGAGKTTLFNVICGFVKPTSGTGSFRSRPLSKVKPHDLAKLGIARTLQGVGLFHGQTVLENVVAGAQSRTRVDFASAILGLPNSERSERRLRDEARAQLDRLGIGDSAAKLPGSLPYGIQKKAAVARALMVQPSLLLLDEPASGLSETETHEFAALIRELRTEMSVLLVEHNMDFVMPLCERLVVLDFGRVIATGSPAQIRDNPQVLEAYLGDPVDGADQ
jgi:branched-chain amino acid transport system ATP-binding protein